MYIVCYMIIQKIIQKIQEKLSKDVNYVKLCNMLINIFKT